jgi:hypothetical protein
MSRVPSGDGAREADYGEKGKHKSGECQRAKLALRTALFSTRCLDAHLDRLPASLRP